MSSVKLLNCWCWRGDYLGSLQVTLQYSNFHLSLGQLLLVNCWCWRGDPSREPGGGWRPPYTLQYSMPGELSFITWTGQLLVVKGWLLGEAGGHLTNNTITNILNFIYQWLGNCWCWRGDHLGSLEVTLQYSNFHLSLTGQLLVVKGWLLGEAGGHLTNNTITNILNFIYQWLGNCRCWRGDYLGRLEATLQYSNFHLSLTGQLLVLKWWLLGRLEATLQITQSQIF